MRRALRPALEADRLFCESLNRAGMAAYRAARGICWDRQRYRDDWARFQAFILSADGQSVGLLQLLAADGALEIRDLQVLPAHTGRGLGTWAISQAAAMALAQGLGALRLRVYAENPARRLYVRLGFEVEAIDDGTLRMSRTVAPGGSASGADG